MFDFALILESVPFLARGAVYTVEVSREIIRSVCEHGRQRLLLGQLPADRPDPSPPGTPPPTAAG